MSVGQGRSLSPEERPTIGLGMRAMAGSVPGQSWAFLI